MARAQSPTDAAPTPQDAQATCLAAHEQAQLDRIEIRLRDAASQLRLCADVACPSVIRGDCIRWAEEVSRGIPSLILAARTEDGDESTVTVYANGELLTKTLDGRPIELDPGPYHLRFERPPAAPVEVQVVLREGEKNRVVAVDFDLYPDDEPTAQTSAVAASGGLPEPRYEDYRPVPLPTYLFGSLAVVSAAGAVGFGLAARQDRADAESFCAPLCEDSEVRPIRSKALTADVATVVAIGSAAAATVFYLRRPTRQRPARAAWGLELNDGGGMVTWKGVLP